MLLGLFGAAVWIVTVIVIVAARADEPDPTWLERLSYVNSWIGAAAFVLFVCGVVVWPIESMIVRIARRRRRKRARSQTLARPQTAGVSPLPAKALPTSPTPISERPTDSANTLLPVPRSEPSRWALSIAPVDRKEPDRGLLPKHTKVNTYRSVRSVWDYEPRGDVFVLEIRDTAGQVEILYEELTSLQAAVDRFVEIALPVQWQWVARVVDSHLASVLAYLKTDAMVVYGDDGMWDGCQAGFDALRRNGRVNEVDIAIWESLAQRMDVW